MTCSCFDPVANADARVLILGTLPGEESLRRKEYYAKKTNRFWQIMGELAGASPELSYDERRRALIRSRIALWDVCRSAERKGSLDARIIMATVVPNDFGVFLKAHPHVRLICFNGRTAENIFRRKVAGDFAHVGFALLPSTSAAHAISREEKLSRWRTVIQPAISH